MPVPGSKTDLLTLEPAALSPETPSLAGPAGTAGAPRRGAASRGPRRLLRIKALVSPVIVLLGWQLVSSAGLVSPTRLPPPTQVWSTAVSLITTSSPAYGSLT